MKDHAIADKSNGSTTECRKEPRLAIAHHAVDMEHFGRMGMRMKTYTPLAQQQNIFEGRQSDFTSALNAETSHSGVHRSQTMKAVAG